MPVDDTMCHCLLQMLIDAANVIIYSMSTDLLFKAPGTLPFALEQACWKQQDDENFGDNSDSQPSQ